MNFAAARRAGERRPLSKPSERLNMARSLLRPRLLDDGLVDAGMFNAGYADAMAGLSWRLTPADVLAAEPRHPLLHARLSCRRARAPRRRNERDRARRQAGGTVMRCIGCGCTDDRACPGGCSWYKTSPPICSACVMNGKICGDAADGFHDLVWLNRTNGYCEACRLPFVAEEVA